MQATSSAYKMEIDPLHLVHVKPIEIWTVIWEHQFGVSSIWGEDWFKKYTVPGRQQSLHAMPQGSSESNSAKQVHALILYVIAVKRVHVRYDQMMCLKEVILIHCYSHIIITVTLRRYTLWSYIDYTLWSIGDIEIIFCELSISHYTLWVGHNNNNSYCVK